MLRNIMHCRVAVLIAGAILVMALPWASGGSEIPWNLRGSPSRDGSHTGRMLLTPESHVHEGPGHSALQEAVYHLHIRDPESGALGPGIPLDLQGAALGQASMPQSLAKSPPPGNEGIDSSVEEALLTGDWRSVVRALDGQNEPLGSPVAQLLLGHAYLALNRNNESVLLLWTSAGGAQHRAWEAWTRDFLKRYPTSAVAHYLHGDSQARLRKWDRAIARFTEALRLQPTFAMARNARGIVRAAREQWDEAMGDLGTVTQQTPSFADGHLSLGTLWIQRRAPEGALQAFEAALKIAPHSALGLNGRACAAFGLGKWEQASRDFAEAGRRSIFPFVLANLRAVSIAAEQAQLPGLESSPLFRVTDFLDWDALSKATADATDPLHAALGGPLPTMIDSGSIERLNHLLDNPLFYEHIKKRIDLAAASKELQALLDETSAFRSKRPDELTDEQREKIRRLNRMLLELAYLELIARHDQRNPGMQLTMKNGLVNPWSFGDQLHWKQGLPVQRLESALGKMYVQKPIADLALSGGLALSTKVPMAGAALTAFGAAWKSALDTGIQSSLTALNQRGAQTPLSNPSGVSTDMRRAYVDKGHWHVMAPFGLAYPAEAVAEDTSPRRTGK